MTLFLQNEYTAASMFHNLVSSSYELISKYISISSPFTRIINLAFSFRKCLKTLIQWRKLTEVYTIEIYTGHFDMKGIWTQREFLEHFKLTAASRAD